MKCLKHPMPTNTLRLINLILWTLNMYFCTQYERAQNKHDVSIMSNHKRTNFWIHSLLLPFFQFKNILTYLVNRAY